MQEWHKYDASDFSYLDSLGYDRIIEEAQQERYSIRSLSNFSSLHSSLDCRTDADLDPMAPLCIGMDYNAISIGLCAVSLVATDLMCSNLFT